MTNTRKSIILEASIAMAVLAFYKINYLINNFHFLKHVFFIDVVGDINKCTYKNSKI